MKLVDNVVKCKNCFYRSEYRDGEKYCNMDMEGFPKSCGAGVTIKVFEERMVEATL